MTSSRARIAVLGGIFAAGLFTVLLHLWFLMVQQNDTWTRRSYENRWAFRSVPSQRGALLDRNGVPLAYDVPATRVSLYYQRFRLQHPVGAAVHGAILWASQLSDRAGTTYYLRPGMLGPRDAARDLLAIPVRMLEPDRLPKDARGDLLDYLRTVLSSCSGLSRAQVSKALREAALAGSEAGVGDVLPASRADLLQRFDERLDELYALGDEIAVAQAEAARRDEREQVAPALLDQLEDLRLASIARRRVPRIGTDDGSSAGEAPDEAPDAAARDAVAQPSAAGDTADAAADTPDAVGADEAERSGEQEPDDEGELGMLVEEIRRPIADDVPFELSARLRVDPARHPGIEVEPWVQRRRTTELGTSLDRLVGLVRALDRTIPKGRRAREFAGELAEARLRADWQDELVPEGIVGDGGERQLLQETARVRLQQELLRRERRGLDGFEQRFNRDLMGVLGMRFVEHDSRRREHRLWSHLRVEAGASVQLTLDVKLQAIAERIVRDTARRYAAMHAEPALQENVQAALAVIDARTGDVLAMAGAPLSERGVHPVPGLTWLKDGSIGSLAKPFVLVEQMESERLGLPHVERTAMRPCGEQFRSQGVLLKCAHPGTCAAHGHDPVAALANSCNFFFYQAGLGLGDDGVLRALRRFGLVPAPDGDAFAACWQGRIDGIRNAPCSPYEQACFRRAIGYGVQATPLFVARAYAGLATGTLPTLGVRAGESRPIVPLGDLHDALGVAHDGLRACVEWGTADKPPLSALKQFGVLGKTGTAEIGAHGENNAWFAGFLPAPAADGTLLTFCAVVYYTPDKQTGALAAGSVVAGFLRAMERDDVLRSRYMP